MKFLVTALLALAFLFTGCTSEDEPAPSEPVESVETPSQSADAVFIQIVTAEYPELDNVEDSVLVDFANNACDSLDAGLTLFDIVENGVASGLESGMVSYMVGAAVGSHCPEHSDLITG